MPEGHTIHRLARRHARLLVGHHVSADSPQGRFEDGARLLDGRVLGATDAWGKHLFHRYDDLWLHVHLGLYGKFRDGTLPAPAARGALRLRLVGGGQREVFVPGLYVDSAGHPEEGIRTGAGVDWVEQDGVMREAGLLNGKFVDKVIYSMLASEWKIHNQS